MEAHPDEEHTLDTVASAIGTHPTTINKFLAEMQREGLVGKLKAPAGENGRSKTLYIYHSDPAERSAPTAAVALKRRQAKPKKIAAASPARKTVKAKAGPLVLSFIQEHRLNDTEVLVRSADTGDEAHYFVLRGVNI